MRLVGNTACLAFLGAVLASFAASTAVIANYPTAVPYNLGYYSSPSAIVADDFNNDANFDIAVSDILDTVDVVLNSGDGTFGGPLQFQSGDYPISIATGHFNRDRNVDMVVSNYNNGALLGSVGVFLGNGNGTFQKEQRFRTGTDNINGRRPSSVAVGDFNGDGNFDIATTNYVGKAVSVLLGDGNGSFLTPRLTPYNSNDYGPSDCTAVDFNRDGRLDLAVIDYWLYSVRILVGDGNGSFSMGGLFPVGQNPRTINTADFNNDGKFDLTVANGYDGTASVLLGNGNGTFTPKMNYNTSFYQARSATAADVNNDRKLDLLVLSLGTQPEQVSVDVFLGNGDGTFRDSPLSFDPETGNTSVGFVPKDLNNDGWIDIAVINNDKTVAIMLNDRVWPRGGFRIIPKPIGGGISASGK